MSSSWEQTGRDTFFTMHQRLHSWRSVQAGFALCAVLRAEQGSGSVSLGCGGEEDVP